MTHDKWVMHFHIGRKGKPFTVYDMGGGVYEVWIGKTKLINLTAAEALAEVAKVMTNAIGDNERIAL